VLTVLIIESLFGALKVITKLSLADNFFVIAEFLHPTVTINKKENAHSHKKYFLKVNYSWITIRQLLIFYSFNEHTAIILA
jgi:hypothetical protein